MGFRIIQKMRNEDPFVFNVLKSVPLGNGFFDDTICPFTDENTLPDPSLFDIAPSLEAGVNLEQVNTKIK